MAMKLRNVTEALSVIESAARTANGTSSVIRLPHMVNAFAFTLDVTAGAANAGDTLDCTVQTKLDGPDGNQWLDVVSFAQTLGSAADKTHIEKVAASVVEAGLEIGSALAAGNVRNLIGDVWRASWTVTNTNAASFTFSVTACPM